jgi:regulatory protein
MRIDRLAPDPRRKGCIRVSVSGRPAWTVPAAVVEDLALRVGDGLGSAALARLEAAAEVEGAVRAGLRMLEHRAHGRHELFRKLALKGHGDAAAAAAVEELGAMGLVNDRAFAEAYVAARAGRGRGPARLRRDLAALGVDPADVAPALATLHHAGGNGPWERTLEQATRRAAAMRNLPVQVRQRRLAAFLARRGFEGAEAREVVRKLVRGGGEA